MITIKSAFEDKKYFSKDEALVRMIILGVKMKMEKGSQYYWYSDGLFIVSDTLDIEEAEEWDTNDSSAIPNWINL